MTDQAALLAAIAASPDDDTLRLAYADWLDEHGGEMDAARAEFIRLSVRRARFERERAWGGPEWAAASARWDHLMLRWDAAWRHDLPVGFEFLSGYHRGLSYLARGHASALLQAGDDPRLRGILHLELTLDVPPSQLPAVADAVCRLVTVLAADSPARIGRLLLGGAGRGDPGVEVLRDSQGFLRLAHLPLRWKGVTAEDVRTLLGSALAGGAAGFLKPEGW